MSTENCTLTQIIDLKALQDFQDKFSKLTNLATITVDIDGKPVTKPTNFSPFCNIIRSTKEGLKRCMKCDCQYSTISSQNEFPIIYNCHAGLTDLSAPIVVNDNYLGYILCGQVFTRIDMKISNAVNTHKLSKELNIDESKLIESLNMVVSMSLDKIKAMADFLHFFSNLVAKMGMVNVIQRKLLNETNENMKYQTLLNDIKFKSLQSQINPHFLFNTLNTIARMALIEEATKTEDLIYSISDLLRYSLNNSDNLVSLEDEIKNIKLYLFIQCTRFQERFHYEIDIDYKFYNCKIPVMTLQPLVENSIIHGLENKSKNGLLFISAKHQGTDLIISIKDNGLGIKENILKNILCNSYSDSNGMGLGVQNVHNRIKYYFGNSYGLHIESVFGEGTEVLIKLPIIK